MIPPLLQPPALTQMQQTHQRASSIRSSAEILVAGLALKASGPPVFSERQLLEIASTILALARDQETDLQSTSESPIEDA